MHKVRVNYSSCTCRSSENICSSSGGAQEKGKRGSKLDETQFGTKKMVHFWVSSPPPRLIYFLAGFFLNLTLFWTKLRVLVLCFPVFTENSTFSRNFPSLTQFAPCSPYLIIFTRLFLKRDPPTAGVGLLMNGTYFSLKSTLAQSQKEKEKKRKDDEPKFNPIKKTNNQSHKSFETQGKERKSKVK